MNVMTEHIEGETLSDDLLNRMAEAGVMGGQHADGSQKDGFLKYERGRPAGIYDLKKGGYVMFADGDWAAGLDEKLGSLPDGHAAWRALLMDPKKDEKLEVYFGNLAKSGALGSDLAKAYLVRSREIGEKLVSDGVANSADDVNGVMMNGFYHLYGPINKHVDLMVGAVR
jgi:general stress protein YciG